MNPSTFETVVGVLTSGFDVQRDQLTPQTPLHAMGLDSLTLMEFVFAIEDHFDLRIPEDKLDPRQTQLTLGDMCDAIDDARQGNGASLPLALAA